MNMLIGHQKLEPTEVESDDRLQSLCKVLFPDWVSDLTSLIPKEMRCIFTIKV